VLASPRISRHLPAPGIRRRLVLATYVVLALAALPALGWAASVHATYALAVAGLVLLIGVIITDIRLVPILTIPFTLVVLRAGGASGLSASDLVLFLGTPCALLVFKLREAPEVRRLLWILAFYESTTLLTVVYNFYRANLIEWIHEAVLVGGSLIVGWVVGRAGRTKLAVTIYMLGACFIALWACLWSATHGFQPAYLPGGMQKNYIGDMLAFGVILAYARPPWFGWRTARWPRVALGVCLLGILASQSKQAMISCAAAIIFMVVRDRDVGRRGKAILLLLLPIVIIAYETVSHEFASHNKFNSVHQRESWFKLSGEVWRLSPILGVGLRWWYTDRFVDAFQPPNGVFEMLTSAGIVGLVGFLVLTFGALIVLWKVPRPAGTLALAVLGARFIQGELDIFWVGAQGSFPWMFAGLVLGALALEQAKEHGWSPLPTPGRDQTLTAFGAR
jgi:hypothetical protein